MSRMVLVRHGQSEWNAEGRWQGWADPDLTPYGADEAARAGLHLAASALGRSISGPPISSDLRRAAHTADLVGAVLDLPRPVLTDPALREIDVGDWSGLRRHEISEQWPGLLQRWTAGELTRAPGGESRSDFDQRVLAACARWLDDGQAATRLVVAHGGVIRSLTALLGSPIRGVPNLGGVVVDPGGSLGGSAGPVGRWTVEPIPDWDRSEDGQAVTG